MYCLLLVVVLHTTAAVLFCCCCCSRSSPHHGVGQSAKAFNLLLELEGVVLYYFIFVSQSHFFCFPACGPAVVTGAVPFSPRLASSFLSRRGFSLPNAHRLFIEFANNSRSRAIGPSNVYARKNPSVSAFILSHRDFSLPNAHRLFIEFRRLTLSRCRLVLTQEKGPTSTSTHSVRLESTT